MAKLYKNEEDMLEQSPDFDIYQPVKGRKRKYGNVPVTLGNREYDGTWHNWYLFELNGAKYGYVYLTGSYHKEIRELCFTAAGLSIAKLLGIKQLGGAVDLKGEVHES